VVLFLGLETVKMVDRNSMKKSLTEKNDLQSASKSVREKDASPYSLSLTEKNDLQSASK
jgi:hypothetical protein